MKQAEFYGGKFSNLEKDIAVQATRDIVNFYNDKVVLNTTSSFKIDKGKIFLVTGYVVSTYGGDYIKLDIKNNGYEYVPSYHFRLLS